MVKSIEFSDIDLFLNMEDGFKIIGASANDYSGKSVSGAGDINGDGYDDILSVLMELILMTKQM